MPKPSSTPRGHTKGGRRPDPDGEAWQAEARGRWQRASNRARRVGRDSAPIEFFEAPPLPAWTAPPHVTRELLGRYLLDRDTNVVHDVAHALPACEVDAIRNGTFYHFETELPGDAIDCTCMGGAA